MNRTFAGAVLVAAALATASPVRADAPEVEAAAEAGEAKDVPALPAKVLKAPDAPADLLIEQHGFLRVVYHPSLFEPVRRLVADAGAIRASLAGMLGQSVLDQVELRVARTPEEMAALSPTEAPPPPRATGVAYPQLSLVVVSHKTTDGAVVDTDEVFRHELAHVGLAEAAAGASLPRWLQEGFAVHASGEHAFRRTQTLFSARLHGELVPFAELSAFPHDPNAQRVAYAQSADFVRWLSRWAPGGAAGGDGRGRFAAAIARMRSGASVDDALTDAYGLDTRGLDHRWREDVAHRFVTVPLILASIAGWALAIASFAFFRKRLRRARRRRALERIEAMREPEIVEQPSSEPRLLVCERGAGHVVYIVEKKGVPKVEHAGKRHTLH